MHSPPPATLSRPASRPTTLFTMNILRQILREAKNLPDPVARKLKFNIKRLEKSNLSEEERKTAADATLRLIRFLSQRAKDDSTLFGHFK